MAIEPKVGVATGKLKNNAKCTIASIDVQLHMAVWLAADWEVDIGHIVRWALSDWKFDQNSAYLLEWRNACVLSVQPFSLFLMKHLYYDLYNVLFRNEIP